MQSAGTQSARKPPPHGGEQAGLLQRALRIQSARTQLAGKLSASRRRAGGETSYGVASEGCVGTVVLESAASDST